MSVAVAHQVSATATRALQEGAREAAFRQVRLDIIHVVDSLDEDIAEANRAGISDAIEKALADDSLLSGITWDLHLVASKPGVPDVASAILGKIKEIAPDLVVIGARRRSPVGKAFLGSVTQNILLDADVPVLVVKSPR
ncbi:universal stress protein [Terrabacter terrigena]|uniref:Universal stress protein n=1 Tax=Terrabacter terrigena TaxID=574718 RepID=A0ABW3N3U6_9MICO